MSFKNTNKYFLLLIFLFLSCKPAEILKEQKSVNFEYDEVKEDIDYIELHPTPSLNMNFTDYYSVSNSFKFLSNTKINKVHTFNFNKKNILEFKPLITIIKNEKIYSLDYESNFNIYDFNNFQPLQSIKIKSKLVNDNNFPTSFAFF